MDIVILDLEWKLQPKKKGYINEIIEFGAVKCDENLVMQDTFSCLVRPQIAKRLNTVITNLTHITDEALSSGVPFMRAVSLFRRWAKDALILTWSTSDVLTLIENCRYFSGNPKVPFLQHYCNLQDYVQEVLGTGTVEQLGLLHAAELLAVEVGDTEHHRALDDSKVALEILRKIYDKHRIAPFIQTCDEDFYSKVTFKTSYISDLQDPLVRRSHLRFACPRCNSRTVRQTNWQYKNKGFRAEFKCNECGYSFSGRLILKVKYEGLTVNRKTFPLPVIEPPSSAGPGPVGQMRLQIAKNGVGFLTFPALDQIPALIHGFSTRIGGVSQSEFAAMNLAFSRGDTLENVQENYRVFAAAVGVPADRMVAGAQDHHTNIRRVGTQQAGIGIWREKDLSSIDGLCTDEPGLPLLIYCADCVPLYFYDPVKQVIGLAHAGWKGTAAEIGAVMVEKLRQEFNCRPEHLTVAIGPSICKNCFEVDLPVAEVFQALPDSEQFVVQGDGEKYHVDLWECNRRSLLRAGVPADQIHIGGVCSMENSRLIFSHRKTRGHRGGNAAILCLRENL